MIVVVFILLNSTSQIDSVLREETVLMMQSKPLDANSDGPIVE